MKKLRYQFRPILATVLIALMLLMTEAGVAEYGDIVFNKNADAAGVRPVIFSHWFHRIRFRCKVCHSELGFVMRAGANDVSMQEIIDGKFCGMCHNGEIAWAPDNCDLCHSGLPNLEPGVRGGGSTGGPGRW